MMSYQQEQHGYNVKPSTAPLPARPCGCSRTHVLFEGRNFVLLKSGATASTTLLLKSGATASTPPAAGGKTGATASTPPTTSKHSAAAGSHQQLGATSSRQPPAAGKKSGEPEQPGDVKPEQEVSVCKGPGAGPSNC